MTSENENKEKKSSRSNSLSTNNKNKNTTINNSAATTGKKQSIKKELNHFSNKAYDEFIPSTYDDDDEIENSNTHSGYFQLAEPVQHDYYHHSNEQQLKNQRSTSVFSALHAQSQKPIIEARPPPTTDLTCVNMNGAANQHAYIISGSTGGEATPTDDYSQLPSNRSDATTTTASLAPISAPTTNTRPRNRSPRNQRRPPRLLLPTDWNSRQSTDLDDDDVIVGGGAHKKAQFA